jgi:hypothetical protein
MRGEPLEKFLVVEDPIADLGQPLLRQVQKPMSLEMPGIDTVDEVPERDFLRPDLLDQAIGIGGGHVDGRRLDDDHHQVIDLTQLLLVLDVPLDPAVVLGQERQRGGLEPETRVESRCHGQEDGGGHCLARVGARHPDYPAKEGPAPRAQHPAVVHVRHRASVQQWGLTSAACLARARAVGPDAPSGRGSRRSR